METQIRRLYQSGFAESLGTFIIVFIGTGSIIWNDLISPIGGLGISISFGLAVYFGIVVSAKYSGAHLNPAVSVMLYFKKDITTKRLINHLLFQCFGAITASLLLYVLAPSHETLGVLNSFILEFLMTLALCYTILWISGSQYSKWTKHAVSFVVFLEAYFGGPYTGASMNPARSLGPALFSGNLDTLWIYIAAPILGAIAAFVLCKYTKPYSTCCPTGTC
jgi:aquaporin NIP